jgi:mannose/cellobiose epimerase-like protein (N-acyl-D-glucosamine 2-epimerase family)
MDPHASFPEFARLRQALTQWFVERAMPFCGTRGTDWTQGGFFERFSTEGQPLDEPRRTRVVARQIYVATQAQALGWSGPADQLVAHGLSFLLGPLLQRDHTFASSMRVDGTMVNARFDLYEQAFALFALAMSHRAQGAHPQATLHATAMQTRRALMDRFKHPGWGFEESEPPSSPLKANPHMHLLEATLAWETQDVPDALAWRALSDEIAQLALDRLIDPATGALSECFDRHWQRLDGPEGDVVEPGHQFEWAWLLMRWGHSRQHPDAIQAAHRLIHLGEQHGICTTRGVALNQINHAFEVVDAQAKLWPQTERIKAWCALIQQAQAAGNEQAMARAFQGATLAMRALQPYLNHPCPGLWQEVMLPDGRFTSEPCRASSLYHIVCAIETLHQIPV